MKPIVNLYFGPQSCEIGRHHLEFEEDNIFQENDPIDHDILQEDNSIFFDLKSNFIQNMQVVDQLDSSSGEQHQPLEIPEHPYKKMKNQLLLEDLIHSNDFNTFFEGGNFQFKEDTEDLIRKVLEKNDYLQGFQMQLDTHNGFGCIGRWTQEYLSEECTKRPISCVNLMDPSLDPMQQINQLISFKELKELSSVLIPMDTGKVYEFMGEDQSIFKGITPTLSSLSLPYRQKNPIGLYNFVTDVVKRKEMNILDMKFVMGGQESNFLNNYNQGYLFLIRTVYNHYTISRGFNTEFTPDVTIPSLYFMNSDYYNCYEKSIQDDYFYINEEKQRNLCRLEGSLPVFCDYQASSGFGDYLQKQVKIYSKHNNQTFHQFYKSMEQSYFEEMHEDILNIIEDYNQ